jgi:hypothetical protein
MTVQTRKPTVCGCKAYSFPHRATGGACHASQSGPFCGECGEPCKAKRMDFGYGRTEFWGSVSTHTDIQTVSTCCEAPAYDDASLTIEHEIERDDF